MSLETRSNSALFKRAEQLKRWEESDTNREPVSPKIKSRRVKFSSGCVFLAACAAGDKEEVLKLLEKGADINTANVDGLTALHQVPPQTQIAHPPVPKAPFYVTWLAQYGRDSCVIFEAVLNHSPPLCPQLAPQ
ncbi:hypothetical protein HUJ05_009189 [Dendroctonus ponderosae]|nr:hypothetical protein HUJ05_009189 [Dendroctonus ponderosae]